MQVRILFFLMFIVVSCKSKNSLLTEKEFAKLYVDSLKKRHTDVEFTLNTDLSISSKFEEQEYKHFTDNAYISYKADPDSIKSIISMYMETASNLYSVSKDIVVENIIPVIKPVEYIDEIKSLSPEKKEPTQFITEKYNDELIIIYAEDSDNNIEYFTEDEFKKLSIAKDTLKSFAMKNFDRELPSIQKQGDKGLYMVTAGGNHEANLILLTSLWTKENFKVDGDIVVAIPNRDIFFVTGSNDKQEITKLKEMADDSYKTGNYSISPYLFKWTGFRFVRFN